MNIIGIGAFGLALVGTVLLSGQTAADIRNGQTIIGSDVLTIRAEIRYQGVCDASAAVSHRPGLLLVANDEFNDLHVYSVLGGKPLQTIALKGLPGTVDADDEIDLEGVARYNNRLWWIGSHSNDSKAEDQHARQLLFSTGLPDDKTRKLKIQDATQDLIALLKAESDLKDIITEDVLSLAPKRGGLNIEGLAAHHDGGLLIGFRSPLAERTNSDGKVKHDALVAHIAVTDGGVELRSPPLRLRLGGRGIRDIVRDGDDYLIIAGSVSSEPDFALYSWDGRGKKPEKLASFFLNGLNPEALAKIGSGWLVLSDDGAQLRPDSSAGDGDRPCKKFRKRNDLGNDHPSAYFRGIFLAP